MDGANKGVVYVRRGEDGKEAERGVEGKGGGRQRFEGKVIRKKGLNDGPLVEKQNATKSESNGDEMDDSSDRDDSGTRKFSEKKWKDISEAEKGKMADGKGDIEADGGGGSGGGRGHEERKEIFGRGKRSVRRFKPTKESGLKLKVRVGGLVRNRDADLPAKQKQGSLSSDFDSGAAAEGKSNKSASEPTKKRRHRLILQENSDDEDYYPRAVPIKKDGVAPRSPAAESTKEVDEDAFGLSTGQTMSVGANAQGVRKSSRVPKRKVLEDFEDDMPDVGTREVGGPDETQHPRSDRDDSVSDEVAGGESGSVASESDDDMPLRQADPERSKAKKSQLQDGSKTQDAITSHGKGRSAGAPLTARQRTMQLGKVGDVGADLIEFPTGLAHLSRRGVQKLSVEERQVKKAEAASRRKQVVERAANELQATAIQKILGQDSSRKRKEDRLQKQREEIEQGKKAAAQELPSDSIRWIFGPDGKKVLWSETVELPSIFSASAATYPPPRQKCAAPSCGNACRYRDSKSNLPLCSLQCYNIVRPLAPLVST